MKSCRKCGKKKPLSKFYRHKQMLDGHLNICIECVKARVNIYRKENIEQIRAYDRKRSMEPHRVFARKSYAKTKQGKLAIKRAHENYKKNYPIKQKAHNILCNAVRDKKIIAKNSCEQCGSTRFVQGHHDNYTKPLDVRWLCISCHRHWHKHNEPKF